MKKLLRDILIGNLLIGIALSTSAQISNEDKKIQEIDQNSHMETTQKTAEGVKNSGKAVVPQDEGQELLATLGLNLDDVKKLGIENCIATYGEDSAGKCQCVIDKTDYDELLSVIMKHIMANPLEAQPTDGLTTLDTKNEENYKTCGLDIQVTKAPTETAVNEAIDKMGLQKKTKEPQP